MDPAAETSACTSSGHAAASSGTSDAGGRLHAVLRLGLERTVTRSEAFGNFSTVQPYQAGTARANYCERKFDGL